MTVSEDGENRFLMEIKQKAFDELPPGDVLVRVQYSSINYKDALSASGNRGVTRLYPHTPGIDAAGIVVESIGSEFNPGDHVLVTGFDLGMNTSGGFAEYIRVPSEWIAMMPVGLTFREAMTFGTAGLTAGLSVYKLTEIGGVRPSAGPILVSGARGGVGSHAVRLLAKLGYEVTAVTGILENPAEDFEKDRQYLHALGAKEVISREDACDVSGKPLLKPRWAGVIDTVGGDILATALKNTMYGGVVTACGNAASFELNINVFPFILRGVTLYGIDSVMCPMYLRNEIWRRFAGDWKLSDEEAEQMAFECRLEDVPVHIEKLLKGTLKGRAVVKV